jgi:hypothetical protein
MALRSGLVTSVLLGSLQLAGADTDGDESAADMAEAPAEVLASGDVGATASSPPVEYLAATSKPELEELTIPSYRHAWGGATAPYIDGVDSEKQPIWLPFGLLDRMRLAPFHMSATAELGSHDSADGTASLTLHAQMSTGCGCNIGIYATLPTSIALTSENHTTQALALGGPLAPQPSGAPRTRLGTLDVGLFSGTKPSKRTSWIYRVGTLLPTGSRDPHLWLPSARAGDRVLELPRSAGVRLSTSKIYGWKSFMGLCFDSAFRIDAGIDVASVLALPGNPVHVIPRAGVGMLATWHGNWVYGADLAVSADPFVDDRNNLRIGAGLTARHARPDGRRSVIQPAVTLATVRTVEGWSASLLLDLTASVSPKD